jgi:hypothetical protein
MEDSRTLRRLAGNYLINAQEAHVTAQCRLHVALNDLAMFRSVVLMAALS